MAKKDLEKKPEIEETTQDNTPAQDLDTQEEATQEETALAVAAMPGLVAGNAADIFKTKLQAMWTSIPQDQPAAILKACQDADYNMMEYFDKNPGGFILVKDVLLHNVEIASEDTGELQTATRTVLIDTNGVTYASVSSGVLSSIQKIFPLFNPPPWPQGLKIAARRVKTRRYQTINLIVVE